MRFPFLLEAADRERDMSVSQRTRRRRIRKARGFVHPPMFSASAQKFREDFLARLEADERADLAELARREYVRRDAELAAGAPSVADLDTYDDDLGGRPRDWTREELRDFSNRCCVAYGFPPDGNVSFIPKVKLPPRI